MTNLFINIISGEEIEEGLKKWSDRLEKPKLDTVYISSLDVLETQRILDTVDHVKEHFELPEKAEVTLECDPKMVRLLQLRTFYGHGINRLSLARPNADHLVEGFSFFDSVNVDGRLFDGLEHVSRYDLKEFDQFEHARLVLMHQGFVPYDRFHFAHIGKECRYLKNVLQYKPYIGVGPNAHSRFEKDGRWMAMIENQEGKLLSEKDVLEEFLLQNFSLYHGLDKQRFEKIFDRDVADCFGGENQWQAWIDQGLIEQNKTHARLIGPAFFAPEKLIAELI